MVVPLGADELAVEDVRQRLVVEQPGERVASRLVGELGGRAVEVGDDALGHDLVDRVVQAALDREDVARLERGDAARDEAPEDAAEDQRAR